MAFYRNGHPVEMPPEKPKDPYVRMNKDILAVINAVILFGRFIISHNTVVPETGFDYISQMQQYYRTLPIPEGMKYNREHFERIMEIGWYSDKELIRLNNLEEEQLIREIFSTN